MSSSQPSRHDIESAEARQSRDARRIKGIYESYGEDLLATYDEQGEVAQHGSQPVASWQASFLGGRPETDRLLDIGCGPRPEVSILLARQGRSVVCTDISLNIAKVARSIALREGADGLQFVVADAEVLPFRARAFDVVVADDVIEHVPADDRMVSECGRVVTATGIASISTPNRRALSVFVDRFLDLLRGRWRSPETYYLVPSHLREYTRGQLRMLARPRFGTVGFVAIGWDPETRLKRLCSAVTTRRPFRYFCRHWILLLEHPAIDGG